MAPTPRSANQLSAFWAGREDWPQSCWRLTLVAYFESIAVNKEARA